MRDAQHLLQRALDALEDVIDDERDALAGIPENMQTRVERGEDTVSDLENARDSILEAIRQLEDAADR